MAADENESAGAMLRRLRLRAGLKQRPLGDRVGKTGQAVSYWEQDRNVPDIDTAAAVDRLLEADGRLLEAWYPKASAMPDRFDWLLTQLTGVGRGGSDPATLHDLVEGIERIEAAQRRGLSAVRDILRSLERNQEWLEHIAQVRGVPKPPATEPAAPPTPRKGRVRPRARSQPRSVPR